MNKPAYGLNDKNEQAENRSNVGVFDHKQLMRQTRIGEKEKLFKKDGENESRRDVASEIDYSDNKSICTTVTMQRRSNSNRNSDTQSVLSKANLDKLNKEGKIISNIIVI